MALKSQHLIKSLNGLLFSAEITLKVRIGFRTQTFAQTRSKDYLWVINVDEINHLLEEVFLIAYL